MAQKYILIGQINEISFLNSSEHGSTTTTVISASVEACNAILDPDMRTLRGKQIQMVVESAVPLDDTKIQLVVSAKEGTKLEEVVECLNRYRSDITDTNMLCLQVVE
jgi:hypothetical protein